MFTVSESFDWYLCVDIWVLSNTCAWMQLKLDNPVDATKSPEGYGCAYKLRSQKDSESKWNLPIMPNKTSLEDVLSISDLQKKILNDLRKKTEFQLIRCKFFSLKLHLSVAFGLPILWWFCKLLTFLVQVLYCLQNPKSTIFGLPIPLVALQVIDLLEQLLVQVFSARTIRFQNQKTCLQNPKSTIFGLPIQLVVLQVIDLYEQLDSKTRKLDVFAKPTDLDQNWTFILW